MKYLKMNDAPERPEVNGDGRIKRNDELYYRYYRPCIGRKSPKECIVRVFGVVCSLSLIALGIFLAKKYEVFGYFFWIFFLAALIVPAWAFTWFPYRDMSLYYDEKRYVEAVRPLRDYYGYTRPNVVTKCFACSEKKFKMRDVCLFCGEDGTLRIAADLKRGFLRISGDIGCYVLEREEFEFDWAEKSAFGVEDGSKEEKCVPLKAGEFFFLLGKRAYGFIKAVKDGKTTLERE